MIVNAYHHEFPDGLDELTLVARVTLPDGTETAAAVETAWSYIQNLTGSWSRGPTFEDGSENPDYRPEIERVAPLHEIDGKTYGLRSSMVGDVFEIDGGDRYRVANLGFTPLNGETA